MVVTLHNNRTSISEHLGGMRLLLKVLQDPKYLKFWSYSARRSCRILGVNSILQPTKPIIIHLNLVSRVFPTFASIGSSQIY